MCDLDGRTPRGNVTSFIYKDGYGVYSYAPISIAPNTGRAIAVPTAKAVCSGGTNAGGNSGLINGCPAGLAGAPFPALTSGLVEIGRTSYVLMSVNPGLVPNNVPVHAVGINADPVGTQLFVPVLTRPATQRTRVSKTILSIAAPPTRKNTLLCI